MTTATLNIGKQTTLIVGGIVTTEKMGSFESIINKFNSIIFTGMSKPAKKEKYEKMLVNSGFSKSVVLFDRNAGFDGINSDVIDFRVEYTK